MLPFSVLDKLLQDLEQSDWSKPTYDSYFVRTIHRLRRIPLGDFNVETYLL
jgi:hypothetical protein